MSPCRFNLVHVLLYLTVPFLHVTYYLHVTYLQFQNLMNDIGRAASKCLEAASKYGEVIIITNSDEGWVNFSAERYVPNLLPILPKYRIISARTAYEQFYPGQPLCWKAAAFAHEVNETFAELEAMKKQLAGAGAGAGTSTDEDEQMHGADTPFFQSAFESLASTDDSSDDSAPCKDEKKSLRSGALSSSSGGAGRAKRKSGSGYRREVISFGDSMEERTAVKIIANQLNALPKSVMFISSPTPEQLIGQLAMLEMHMKYVCTHASALDLEISPHQAEKCAATILGRRRVVGGGANDHHQHRPLTNTVPRMRRVSEKGLIQTETYDETFSL